MRGTFANIRLRNGLVEGTEGPYTVHLPDGEEGFIYDVAMRYGAEGVPLAVIAGREYGSGSSRDWAAKGPALLGVRFALAESFERIHRSNLVGMGVLPLQFKPGESAASLGLTGREVYSVTGLAGGPTAPPDGGGHRVPRPGLGRRRGPAPVRCHRPPRRPDRRRVLPRRRDPAGRPAPARDRGLREPPDNEEAPGGGTGGFCAEERASLSLGRVPQDVTRVGIVFRECRFYCPEAAGARAVSRSTARRWRLRRRHRSGMPAGRTVTSPSATRLRTTTNPHATGTPAASAAAPRANGARGSPCPTPASTASRPASVARARRPARPRPRADRDRPRRGRRGTARHRTRGRRRGDPRDRRAGTCQHDADGRRATDVAAVPSPRLWPERPDEHATKEQPAEEGRHLGRDARSGAG